MKVAFWLLAAVVAAVEVGLMAWTLPRKNEERLLAAKVAPAEPNPKGGPVVCLFDPPCWQDGKPVLGELKRYTVCGIAGPCWVVEGVPVSR